MPSKSVASERKGELAAVIRSNRAWLSGTFMVQLQRVCMHPMDTPSPLPSINKSYISGILYDDCFLAVFIIYESNVKRKTSKEPRNIESEEQNKTKQRKTNNGNQR